MPEFKPSLAYPLQAVQCRAPVKNGDAVGRRCKKKAILGGLMCRSRGAQLPSVREAAARAVDDARLRLLLASEDAVAVLEVLMDEGQSEGVRLRAAVEILDRARIRGGFEVRPLPLAESPARVLEERLTDLRAECRMSGLRIFILNGDVSSTAPGLAGMSPGELGDDVLDSLSSVIGGQ